MRNRLAFITVCGFALPKAESRKPKAESRKPKAESRKPKAESRKPKAPLPNQSVRAEDYSRGFYEVLMASFKLVKWYLDCVTPTGEVLIAYTGTAQWGKLRLHYSSILESANDRIVARYSLRPQLAPSMTNSTISWNSKPLKIDASWQGASSGISQTIYRSAEGQIEWDCRMPLARATIGARQGLGYVENLTMTIPPWKLPIHTLLWGRFTSATDWLTWIDWQGDHSRRIVYLNGDLLPCPIVEDNQIEAEDKDQTRLSMRRSLVLRNGRIGTTALSVVPGIEKMFPKQLVEMNECKWRSWARLERKGKPPVEGWAIHERLNWPQ
jgi:hypothetical protein